VHSFFVSESGNSIDTYSKHVYYFAKDNEKAVRSYQGDIFQLPEGTLSVPSPVQGDSPPVFVAATESFNKELVEAMKGSIWLTGCQSWYLDADGNPVTWPWTPFQNRVLSCLNFCNGTVPHPLKIKPLREGDTACVNGGMAMSAR
jgi:hypothetical protein